MRRRVLQEAQIDDRARIGAHTIVLDKPEADITTAWIDSLTAGGQLEEDLDRVADQVSTFRLGQFSILDNGGSGSATTRCSHRPTSRSNSTRSIFSTWTPESRSSKAEWRSAAP